MNKRHWISGAIIFTLPFCSYFSQSACADIYHSVQNGDTLNSVATKYQVASDVLRSLNKLSAYSDRDALPAMLLRVPEGNSAKTQSVLGTTRAQSSAAIVPSFADLSRNLSSSNLSSTRFGASTSENASANAQNGTSASGSISKSFVYVVQAGDTLESIAKRHTEFGYPVSVQAIRTKNAGAGSLAVGRTLIIPVGTTRLVSSEVTVASTPSVSNHESLPAPDTRQAPLFSISNVPAAAPKTTARRGPTVLNSRGYTPSSNYDRGGNKLDGARVLDPLQDATVTGTPLGRMRTRVPQVAAPRAVNPSAQVARIAKAGARIRRLPDAGATTLYKCSTGTEIAVTKQSGEWSAILMSDRSTGWIPSKYLKFTGQSVDISTQVVAAASYSSAGDFSVRSADGRWNSTNPMVAQALGWLGTPYVYGGESRRGIDCSAMIQSSFRVCGYKLPRTAAEQARVGTPIQPSDLQAGDRLYFSASGTRVDHTGLYMGNGLFVHASGRGRSVIVSKLFDRRNWNIYVGARR